MIDLAAIGQVLSVISMSTTTARPARWFLDELGLGAFEHVQRDLGDGRKLPRSTRIAFL